MSHDHHNHEDTNDHMDHGGMDHGGMDHGNHGGHANHEMDFNTPSPLFNLTSVVPVENIGHDHHAGHGEHASHGGSMDHSMMGMKMYFHFGYTEDYVLFTFWNISTIGGLIGSMIGIFLLAMLYEGLKVLREFLLHRSMRLNEGMSRQSGSSASSNGLRVPLAGEQDSVQDSQNVVIVKSFFRPNPFSVSHTIQTVLHMLQMIVSYLLMLIFMTYNLWLCLAVVMGAGAGYFVFGWRKRTIIDINEHCH